MENGEWRMGNGGGKWEKKNKEIENGKSRVENGN